MALWLTTGKLVILAFSLVFCGIILERSCFREIPTKILTFIGYQVCMFIYSLIAHSWSEIRLDTHTHT